ncbi:hypothetical protein V8E53_005137 [Lactarius tabidus]
MSPSHWVLFLNPTMLLCSFLARPQQAELSNLLVRDICICCVPSDGSNTRATESRLDQAPYFSPGRGEPEWKDVRTGLPSPYAVEVRTAEAKLIDCA